MAASTAAIMGWYGPLIDLSKVPSYMDDFVQLLVFVHSSLPQPLRNKNSESIAHQKSNTSTGQPVLKTNILVSDDTRSYFSVSIWQKHMGSMIVAGDIILLQNVKIVKYRDVLEAATNQFSSLLVLIHSYELGASKDIDGLVALGQLRESAKGKLTRVVNWVQHTESALQLVQKPNRTAIRNWKACEEKNSTDRSSISEALRLVNRSHAKFHAFIGEIFMPFMHRPDEFETERFLFSKRLFTKVKNNIVEDFISKGCKLCGSPMVSSTSVPEQIKLPLYCAKASNYHHSICMIYKPFLMYVWDQSGQIPLLVKNKAAEILFGNITAENVYKCYKEVEIRSTGRGYERKQQHHCSANPNFYHIWLILAKALLQHEKNSPFGFEIAVDREKDIENGRFELVSFTMPCCESGKP